jgi:leader peptidase (prepilin peptidase)/N-methyltransferase
VASGVAALAACMLPLGAAVGSFLNVVIHRLPRGQSLVAPRSRCPACEAPIGPLDNVPILSWIRLRGRCRHCRAAISARYPLVEAITAVAFAAVVLARGLGGELVALLPFTAVLVAVAFIDLDHRIVPNRVLLPAAVFGVASAALFRTGELAELCIAGAAAFGFLLLAALAYPAGMGMGDVKLAGVMGLYLGSSVVPALLFAFSAGAVVGIVTLAREGPSARKKGIPFAPFLALGGLVGVLAGPALVHLYVTHYL